jgi:hypothetical protein
MINMSKVKVRIEYNGDIQEYECDIVLMGGANIEQREEGYPRVAVHGAMMGNSDLLSLNRIYAALGNEIHKNNIKQAYGVGTDEANESVKDISPKVKETSRQLTEEEELSMGIC